MKQESDHHQFISYVTAYNQTYSASIDINSGIFHQVFSLFPRKQIGIFAVSKKIIIKTSHAK